jgi:hypothetical protein
MLAGAIKAWPKNIDNVLIDVATDDFIRESKNASKFKPDKKGKATLAAGWIPTEKDMQTLVNGLKKDQPALRKFRLVISVRSSAFTGVFCKPIFDFTYASRELPKPRMAKGSKSSGSKDKPIDVEDFVAASSSKPKRADETQHTVVLDQSVIQELYNATEKHEDDSEMEEDRSDGYDSWEEEIAMRQGAADEYAGFAGFEEDDEDDELFGMGGRPRWAAF